MGHRLLRMLPVLVVLALGVAAPARAQLTVQITQGVADAVPIAVVPFAWSAGGQVPFDVAQVAQSDLERSGRFAPLARQDMLETPSAAAQVNPGSWRLLKVDYVVVGRLVPTGGEQFEVQFELVSTLTGQRLLGLAIPAERSRLRLAGHQVADAIYEKIVGVKGAFATRIGYIAVDGTAPNRRHRLIVADADGENMRVIVQSTQPIMSPAWSPDGQSLAYVSFEGGLPAIFVQTLRTGQRVRVSARAGINGAPAWAPDGSRLAVTLSGRDGNVDLYLLNLSTQELTRLTDDAAIDTEPEWSRDGRTLYFTSDRAGGPQVYQLAVDGDRRARRVTFEGSYNARPRLSPDGRQLAVVTLDRGAYRIGMLDFGGAGLRVLTGGRLDESPSFAPNGAMLIYSTRDRGRRVLATVSTDGRVQQRISAPEGDVREPVWAPFAP